MTFFANKNRQAFASECLLRKKIERVGVYGKWRGFLKTILSYSRKIMFFEYQLDEEIKEIIGIGFHSIERSRLSELQCYVYMVVQEKKGEKIVVLELKVQVKELKPSLLFNWRTCYSFIQFTKRLFKCS